MRRPLIGQAVVDWHPQEAKNDPKIIHNLSLLGFYTDDKLVGIVRRRRWRWHRRWLGKLTTLWPQQYSYMRRDYMIGRGRPPVQKGMLWCLQGRPPCWMAPGQRGLSGRSLSGPAGQGRRASKRK